MCEKKVGVTFIYFISVGRSKLKERKIVFPYDQGIISVNSQDSHATVCTNTI